MEISYQNISLFLRKTLSCSPNGRLESLSLTLSPAAFSYPLSVASPLPKKKKSLPSAENNFFPLFLEISPTPLITEDAPQENGLQLFAYSLDTCRPLIGFLNPLSDSLATNEEATRGLLKLLHLAK